MVKWMSFGMIITAVPTFVALVFFKRAPYGRYYVEAKDGGYGFLMNGKLAWVLQELPCVVFSLGSWFFFSDLEVMSSKANMALLGIYLLHYIHRYSFHHSMMTILVFLCSQPLFCIHLALPLPITFLLHSTFIFPLNLRGGKPTPFYVFLGALCFCLYNGLAMYHTLSLASRRYEGWKSKIVF